MDPIERVPEDDDLTVLEYVRRWFHNQLKITEKPAEASREEINRLATPARVKPLLWIGLFLVAIGQLFFSLESQALPIVGLLAIGTGMVILWFGIPSEAAKVENRIEEETHGIAFQVKPIWILATLVMSLVCFLLYTENRFGWLQTLSWLTAIACGLVAFWPESNSLQSDGKLDWRFWQGWRRDRVFFVLALTVALVGLVFRLQDLPGVPPEVISAQVESYYSVSEISQGGNYVLFSRNTVAEPLNYYWANIVNLFTGKSLSVESLRLANALAGLIGMGFVYGLGKTMADGWLGLVAAGLAGGSYWLVLQERAVIGGGLVFPLMAAALYGLIKGLEERDGRFFLLSAVAVGLGLMSNKIFLVYPLASLMVILCWRASRKVVKPSSMFGLLGIGSLLSLIAALPLLRAISLEPIYYFAPILARVSEYEVTFSGNPLVIFLGNFVKALGLVNWTNQGSWVDSIANRGAVDGLTGIFFLVGIVSLIRRYQTSRDWKLLALLLLYPVLLLPSALVLAFPTENPSMTRAIGAAIPVLLVAAYGIVDLFRLITGMLQKKSIIPAFVLGVVMLGPILLSNHNLVFKQYSSQYKRSAWNASEMAEVISRFYSSGKEGLSYLISFPYWVDSRAVAISMGRPEQNLSLPATEIANTLNVTLPKLFILNLMDKDSIAELQAVYPEGVISTYQSTNPDKNFILFIVGQ